MTDVNYRDFYDLEEYLFGTVTARFQSNHRLDAFDFFCIVIWKANRAKSRIAKLLLQHGSDLESVLRDLTTRLAAEKDPKARLQILLSGWKFHLPMASAILTVLYPHEFTVYDVRVCNILGDFHKVQDRPKFDELWAGYQRYVAAVRQKVPEAPELREKDRWLWGKSFHDQLKHDISAKFKSVLRDSAVLWIQQLPAGRPFTYADVECFLRTEYPEDVSSDGADYKNDAQEAVAETIKRKLVARLSPGNFERQSEDGV